MTASQFDDDRTLPDLRVGEIRALRTFRLSEYGYLNPVGIHGRRAVAGRPEHRPVPGPGSHAGRARLQVRLLRLRHVRRGV